MNTTFNSAILADLMIQGYKHVILSRAEDVITVVPVRNPVSREELMMINMTQLNLSDPVQLVVLQHVDLLDEFIFVIDSKYFVAENEHQVFRKKKWPSIL